MKRLSWLAIFLGMAIVAQGAYAATDKEADAKKAALRKKIEAKKLELNGSQWEVSLKSSDPKAKLTKDTFTFQNNQVSSKNNSDRGFTPTNYTITIPSEDGEAAIWESMQTGSKGEVIFFRGEWLEDNMTGVISEQQKEGDSIEYSFTTAKRVEVAKTREEEAPLAGQSVSAPEVLVAKEAIEKDIKAPATKSTNSAKKLVSY